MKSDKHVTYNTPTYDANVQAVVYRTSTLIVTDLLGRLQELLGAPSVILFELLREILQLHRVDRRIWMGCTTMLVDVRASERKTYACGNRWARRAKSERSVSIVGQN